MTVILLSLIAWAFTSLLCFIVMPKHKAVLLTMLGGWLFLPVFSIALPGAPDLNKRFLTCTVAFAGAMMSGNCGRASVRVTKFDVPVLVWCFCPVVTSMSNGLGLYDGLSAALAQLIEYGLPYSLGRMLFTEESHVLQLVRSIVISTLLYVPLCLYEIRMSPQLHRLVYGYFQHQFVQTRRFNGWRPTVFMEHGLAVSLWMVIGTIIASTLWITYRGEDRRPILYSGGVVALLLTTTVLCKSFGALIIMTIIALAFCGARFARSPALIIGLIVCIPLYLIARIGNEWNAEYLVKAVANVSVARAESLQFRLSEEAPIISKTLERPIFGWGRWGRFRVTDDAGRDVSVVDSLWIIAFGQFGLVGLASLMAFLLLPVAGVIRMIRIDRWTHPSTAAIVSLALGLLVYTADKLFNAMSNPIMALIAGAVTNAVIGGEHGPRTLGRATHPMRQELSSDDLLGHNKHSLSR